MPGRSRVPAPLLLGLFAFLAVLAWLVGASFVRPEVATRPPDPLRPEASPAAALREDTLTIDARDADRWRFVDLARGTVLTPPDTAGWHLAMRRFHVIASGGLADLGRVAFEAVARAPTVGYVETTYGADTVNAAIARWYEYRFLSHTLRPDGRVWALRTREGRYAKFTVLGYYCPGSVAGCVTVRYAYQPDGSRHFE